MTGPETDLDLIGGIYREQMAATRQHWLAYQACLEAWRERHPGVAEKEVGEQHVAKLIARAINDGLVWPNARWWEKK